MRNTVLLFFLGLTVSVSAQRSIYGRVNDGSNPLENVRVLNTNSQTEVETDTKGYYKIEVATGDLVRYELYGFRTVEVVVEDVTRILNTVLIPEVNELDEVVVEGGNNQNSQRSLQERYQEDKSVFLTATGYRDMEAVSGSVDIIDGDNINFSYTCILDLMRRFNRVRVFGSCLDAGGTGQVFLNRAIGNSLIYPQPVMYDIDGQVFTDTPLWLDPQNIKRLAILNSLNLANSYGTLANGGVILINTKLASLPYAGKEINQQKAEGSNAVSASFLDRDKPQYLLDMEAAANSDEALSIYEKYKSMYSASPYFYLDMAKHLWEDRGDRRSVEKVLEEGEQLWSKNPVLLKGKAFLLDAMGETDMALSTYQRIFELRPNYAQSFRDLAQAYARNKEPKKAAAHFSRYNYVKEEKMMDHASSDFDTLTQREQKQLLRKYGDEIIPDYNKFLNLEEEDFAGTRLVLEWNDGEAEFDLEFVNPQNQTYTWRHSLIDSPDQIQKEKEQGYSSKEFLLDGSLPGVWKMNVKYLGNKSLTPTYFKLTQYTNFGLPTQSEKISFYKVMTKGVNFELAAVVDSGRVSGK